MKNQKKRDPEAQRREGKGRGRRKGGEEGL